MHHSNFLRTIEQPTVAKPVKRGKTTYVNARAHLNTHADTYIPLVKRRLLFIHHTSSKWEKLDRNKTYEYIFSTMYSVAPCRRAKSTYILCKRHMQCFTIDVTMNFLSSIYLCRTHMNNDNIDRSIDRFPFSFGIQNIARQFNCLVGWTMCDLICWRFLLLLHSIVSPHLCLARTMDKWSALKRTHTQ